MGESVEGVGGEVNREGEKELSDYPVKWLQVLW